MGSDPFGDQINLIADSDGAMIKASCKNLKDFRKFIQQCLETCAGRGPSAGSYAVIRNIRPNVFEKICQVETSESTRLTYDYMTQQMIVKCMPGAIHDIPCARLIYEIIECVCNIPGHTQYSVVPMATTRMIVPGIRSKEGDQGLKPETRGSKDAWPSLMMEVCTLLKTIKVSSDKYCTVRVLRIITTAQMRCSVVAGELVR